MLFQFKKTTAMGLKKHGLYSWNMPFSISQYHFLVNMGEILKYKNKIQIWCCIGLLAYSENFC